MAFKAKKRKLTVTPRRDRHERSSQAFKADAVLLHQADEDDDGDDDDEMFTVAQLLKEAGEKGALTVAKHVVRLADASSLLEGTHSSDAEGSTGTGLGGSRPKLGRKADRMRSVQPRPTRTSTRHQKGGPDLADHRTATAPILSGAGSVTGGLDSTVHRNASSARQEGESWLADLTIANIQKQNLAHEQEEQRLQEIEEADTATAVANGLTADESALDTPKRSGVTILRPGLRRAMENGSKQPSDSEKAATFATSIKSPPSAASETSASFVASFISDPSAPSNPQSSGVISVAFRSEGEQDTSSTATPLYEIPVSALTKPSLTKTFIQEKARSIYAPAALSSPDPPKRRPGRPPGYFLGPTSCAYCRIQHRRCDYNTVCSRCIKAKVSCDRSGTVERPSVIVREARQQARAEAAAALAAAVAAGLTVVPEKPFRPPPRSELYSLTLEAKSIGAQVSAQSSQGSATGVKRTRNCSPSDVSKENIIERRVKRVATESSVKKYDPSVYLRPKSKAALQQAKENLGASSSSSNSQRGRSMTRDIDDIDSDEDENNHSTRRATSAGPPSKIKGAAFKTLSKNIKKQKKTGKSPDSKSLVKTGRGRPTNATRYAKDPSLIPPPKPEKAKRKLGRPPKSVASTATVPMKRARESLSEVTTISDKKGKGKGKGKQVSFDSSDDEGSVSSSVEPTKISIPLVKKTYLKSGLYSADLKTNQANNSKLVVTAKEGMKQAVQTSKALATQSKRGAINVSQSSSLFQLPINYGAVLMSNRMDFHLPFDIMQAWEAGLLRKKVQPEPFVKIRSNIFVERKRRTETSPMVCHCTPPPKGAGRVGCGEDCYNRVMFYECISAHCPCGDQCSNQRFQRKHSEGHLQVIWTKERGFGIQTVEPIKKGSLVIEYRGEVISQSECHRRMETIYKNNKNFYFLEYEKGEVVDACQKGTNARFVNHSCSPNSQIEKWFLNGEMSIGIFASQDIAAGAEISYDYNFSSFSRAQKQKCRCGAPNCRGFIGERSSKSKETGSTANAQASGRTAKNVDGRKRKAGRRKVNDQELNSLRMNQMPSVRQIRQRQSDKYKEDKMAAIRYTKLFLFRNIRLVESKYIKYAQTKSRSYQETVSRPWLQQARQCRKRSLEGVVNDLRAEIQEKEDEEIRERMVEEQAGSSVGGDDDSSEVLASASSADEDSTLLELDNELAEAEAADEDEVDGDSEEVEGGKDESEEDELEGDSEENGDL